VLLSTHLDARISVVAANSVEEAGGSAYGFVICCDWPMQVQGQVPRQWTASWFRMADRNWKASYLCASHVQKLNRSKQNKYSPAPSNLCLYQYILPSEVDLFYICSPPSLRTPILDYPTYPAVQLDSTAALQNGCERKNCLIGPESHPSKGDSLDS
jgi:hypothetical protein